MKIYVKGLDTDYKDCAVEMGGRIIDVEDSVNVVFPDTVRISTDGKLVNFISPTVGMVLTSTEFVRIEIV